MIPCLRQDPFQLILIEIHQLVMSRLQLLPIQFQFLPLSPHTHLLQLLALEEVKLLRRNPLDQTGSRSCKTCKRGFQLRRDPPLHISCRICKLLVHERCLSLSSSLICRSCQPEVQSSPLPPSATPPGPSPSLSRSSPPRQSGCCDEFLLTEGEGSLPSYHRSEEEFNMRMSFLGFKRSPSQPDTQGDGNCGIYALLDQL